MSRQHVQQKLDGRHALHEIFMSVRYLCQKGLPLQGDKGEKDSNLNQLLYMKYWQIGLRERRMCIPVQQFKMK